MRLRCGRGFHSQRKGIKCRSKRYYNVYNVPIVNGIVVE